MKLFKITSLLCLLTSVFIFSGCDTDDHDFPPQQTVRAYLTKYGSTTIRYDKDNKIIGMLDQRTGDNITFDYPSGEPKSAKPKTVQVTGVDKNYTMHLTYGENGLIKEVQSKYNETLIETWNFTYNARNVLHTISKTKENKISQINLIYIGSDILAIDEISEGVNNNIATFKYLDGFNDKLIENRGRLLLLEEMVRSDFGGITYLSYAGLLGYGGNHLPRKGNVRNQVLEYDWEFNLYGLPTEIELEINDIAKEKKLLDWRIVPIKF